MKIRDHICHQFFLVAQQPTVGRGPPHYRGSTITLRHTTLGRTPLDEWSARRRDLYLTTHNTHDRQTFMLAVIFVPAIPASEQPQTHALDRAAIAVRTVHIRTKVNVVPIGSWDVDFSSANTPSLQHCVSGKARIYVSTLTICVIYQTSGFRFQVSVFDLHCDGLDPAFQKEGQFVRSEGCNGRV
jgi:hypothetical protein